MPRQKPLEPLKPKEIRLSERQAMILKQLGGAAWLREMLEKKAPLPKRYYDNELARLRNPDDAVFLRQRKGEIND